MILAYCPVCRRWVNQRKPCPHPASLSHWAVYDDAGVVIWSGTHPPIVEVPPCSA